MFYWLSYWGVFGCKGIMGVDVCLLGLVMGTLDIVPLLIRSDTYPDGIPRVPGWAIPGYGHTLDFGDGHKLLSTFFLTRNPALSHQQLHDKNGFIQLALFILQFRKSFVTLCLCLEQWSGKKII
jgi:hypothetical protein